MTLFDIDMVGGYDPKYTYADKVEMLITRRTSISCTSTAVPCRVG